MAKKEIKNTPTPEVKVWKKGELLAKYRGIEKPFVGVQGIKFLYALSINRDKLKNLTKNFTMDKVIPASEEYSEYTHRSTELWKSMAIDPETGLKKIIYTPDGQEILNINPNDPIWLHKKSELNLEYQKAMDERDTQLEEYKKFLADDCEFEFIPHLIDFSYLPSNLTDEQMMAVSFMVRDFTDEQKTKFDDLFREIYN